jgi:hypothetical protein
MIAAPATVATARAPTIAFVRIIKLLFMFEDSSTAPLDRKLPAILRQYKPHERKEKPMWFPAEADLALASPLARPSRWNLDMIRLQSGLISPIHGFERRFHMPRQQGCIEERVVRRSCRAFL